MILNSISKTEIDNWNEVYGKNANSQLRFAKTLINAWVTYIVYNLRLQIKNSESDNIF